MPFATAADLPPEVVARIAHLCYARDGRYNLDRSRLAACSLTCRYWSQLARRNLLESITLKSAADISQLLEYLETPTRLTPSLRECIQYLYLVDRQPSPKSMPWLHHLVRLKPKLDPGVPVLIICTVDSSQSTPAPTKAAPHAVLALPLTTLPRTLPSSVFKLWSLTLRNIQLPSPAYLLRCLSHLIFNYVRLEQVTFTDLSMLGVRIPSQRPCRREVTVKVESDLLSNMDSFHSCLVLSHTILVAQGCPSLNEHTTSLVRDHTPVLLLGTMPRSIDIKYTPQDPTKTYSALDALMRLKLPSADLMLVVLRHRSVLLPCNNHSFSGRPHIREGHHH